MEVNASLVNFAAGVLSKKFLGRTDLPNFYKAGLLTCENFYPQAQGPADFRQGTKYVMPTRLNQEAVLYPFVFNDEQAYALSFTEEKLRFFNDGDVIFGQESAAATFPFLVHFDGADAATAYTAESGQVLTFKGNAQLDTAQKVFGASALLMAGAGDYVTAADSDDYKFGTDEFTIDFRFKMSAGFANEYLLGSKGGGMIINVVNATTIRIYSTWGSYKDFTVSTLSHSTWYHFALTREGKNLRLFINGVKQGVTNNVTGVAYNLNTELQIGSFNTGAGTFDGWIDELAFRKTAVWTTDFVIPSTAYGSTGTNVITAISQADPGVVTCGAHGFTGGEQIYISDVLGMTELNSDFYLVAYIDADTFSLTDLDGTAIDTSAYTAYISGGTYLVVYEIDTPYAEEDLDELQFAQKADLMYITHKNYEPRKLIRSGTSSWALSTYTRTDDPFTKTISGATQADPCVVTATAHGFSNGDLVEIYGVAGMTQLNGNTYKVANKAADTFELTDPTTDEDVDSSGYGAYTSAGYVFKQGNMPSAVAFYGGRLFFGGTDDEPESFWGSKAPDNDGTTNYDVFTVGTSAEDALTFPIASQNNNADRIHWFAGTNKFLGIGTYGGVYKANGGSDSDPISGTAIAVQALEFVGCKYMPPVRVGSTIFYAQRGGKILNKFAYSLLADDFSASSLNIFSDEITSGGLKQLAVQQGTTDFIWVATDDGKLLGMTVKTEEEVSAWHGPHLLGGEDVKVLSVCGEPQSDNLDSLWLVVERTLDGSTQRFIEHITAESFLPEREDYYTGVEATDTLKYRKLQYEAAKQLIRVDSALTLDQTQTNALTPGAVTGTGVSFTVASDTFVATDVGRYIVRKYVTGDESGCALITAYVSATEVTCTIIDDFDAVTEIDAGNWYLTATTITGLNHLEGETVRVQIDGADGGEEAVSGGSITIDSPGTVIHVGLAYTGRIQTMPLDIGALVGTAQGKITTLNRLGLLIRNTMGVKFGSRLYDLEQTVLREDGLIDIAVDGDQLLETDVKFLNLPDGYDRRKYVHIVQDAPFPCTVQGIVPYVDTTNE